MHISSRCALIVSLSRPLRSGQAGCPDLYFRSCPCPDLPRPAYLCENTRRSRQIRRFSRVSRPSFQILASSRPFLSRPSLKGRGNYGVIKSQGYNPVSSECTVDVRMFPGSEFDTKMFYSLDAPQVSKQSCETAKESHQTNL